MLSLDLNQLKLFAAVAETENFSRAASLLGLPRSTVSRAVAALEDELGVQLFHRTTRKVVLTSSGKGLFSEVQPRLRDIATALSRVADRNDTLNGTVRLTVPHDLGALELPPLLADFARAYPEVQLRVDLSNTALDLQAEHLDVALRLSGLRWEVPSLEAVRLTAVDARVYAAPAYLEQEGAPVTWEQARAHRWVAYTSKPLPLATKPPFGIEAIGGNDVLFMAQMAREGMGLTLLPTFVARRLVEAGDLVPVSELRVSLGALYFVCPAAAHLPRRIEVLREYFARHYQLHPLAGEGTGVAGP